MDLHTIDDVVRPRERGELPEWRPGDAWLAGGTWLFSEPQPGLRRLVDLTDLRWPALEIGDGGLSIAATCTIAALERADLPASWTAAPLVGACCRALLGSFKVWNAATVGGNLCMALPAGPMIALAVTLDATCVVWTLDRDPSPAGEGESAEADRGWGGDADPGCLHPTPVRSFASTRPSPPGEGSSVRRLSALDLVLGPQQTALAPGEILRAIDIPAAALARRTAFRRISLSPNGRSGALLIGTRADDGLLALTVTASTRRPVRLDLPADCDAERLRAILASAIPPVLWYDDVHGAPDWRAHVTALLAEEIRAELVDGAA